MDQTDRTTTDGAEHSRQGPGGRLALLHPADLDPAQHALSQRLRATRVVRARRTGYAATDADDRLIGPFNALLRVPTIALPQLDWAEAISAAPLPATVREVVVLTVAARWRASYVLHAHRRAALAAGVPEAVVRSLADGGCGGAVLGWTERLAHRVAHETLDGRLGATTYDHAVEALGEGGLVTVLCLMGQYVTTCLLVTAVDVPVPTP